MSAPANVRVFPTVRDVQAAQRQRGRMWALFPRDERDAVEVLVDPLCDPGFTGVVALRERDGGFVGVRLRGERAR